MKKFVSGVAVAAAVCVGFAAGARAENVNRILKDSGPGMQIVPASGPGDFAWQGMYIGASVGGGWGTSTQHYDRAGDHGAADLDLSGGAIAVTGGYNWRMTDRIVGGIEADLGVMNVSKGTTTVFDGHEWSSDVGPFWGTLRGRAGYLVNDRLLAYATAGLAFSQVDDTSIGNTAGETAKESGLRPGLALGLGVEYAMSQTWSLKAEYLYLNLAEVNGQSDNDEDYSFDSSVSIIRIGANMQF
ncbi:MAG: porin family protein [Rhizobiales bacterium]|nr:porin family protein [Hyphomicrobiales bacterium]